MNCYIKVKYKFVHERLFFFGPISKTCQVIDSVAISCEDFEEDWFYIKRSFWTRSRSIIKQICSYLKNKNQTVYGYECLKDRHALTDLIDTYNIRFDLTMIDLKSHLSTLAADMPDNAFIHPHEFEFIKHKPALGYSVRDKEDMIRSSFKFPKYPDDIDDLVDEAIWINQLHVFIKRLQSAIRDKV